MKESIIVVGKAKGAVGEAIGEYEVRARRYFAGHRKTSTAEPDTNVVR